MAGLEIVKFPKNILRKCVSKVDSIGDEEKNILADMAKTMYLNGGVGLAANQVGIDKQLAVIDVGKGLIKMANPVIVKKDGVEVNEEGCLSVPNAAIKVKRAKKVVVSFLDEKGQTAQIEADGLLARAIQHELDHLSGKLIIDYLSPLKKLFRRNI